MINIIVIRRNTGEYFLTVKVGKHQERRVKTLKMMDSYF